MLEDHQPAGPDPQSPVPVVYVIFTVLGVVSRALGHDPAQLAREAGITGVLAGTVVKVADQSTWTLVALVLGAVVTMFITAGGLLKALYVVHWLIWRVPRVKPAGVAPKLVLIGLAVAGSAVGVAVNDMRDGSWWDRLDSTPPCITAARTALVRLVMDYEQIHKRVVDTWLRLWTTEASLPRQS